MASGNPLLRCIDVGYGCTLTRPLTSHSYSEMVWLGGRKSPPPLNDKWTFTDGSPFDYTNWDTGEPNNYDGKENCLQLLFDQNIGREEKRWNDITCDSRMPHFVCKRSCHFYRDRR
ncbi:hypothetical protein RB195_013604 [Necator americanus]|uniref:C-type lectin domain-containing protein n=1 Tax=Necator americanus TaxID=51031 RepID=A0ABR1DWZ1_NECAM